jgi:hypothetical protein
MCGTVSTRRGEAGTHCWGSATQEGARGLTTLHIFLSFSVVRRIFICPLYKLNLSDQAQATLQLSQSFRFSVWNFSPSAIARKEGGGCKKFSHRGPKPLSAALLV